MILAVYSGTSMVLSSGITLKLDWARGGTADQNSLSSSYGPGSISYCPPIPVGDADQVGIYVFPTGPNGYQLSAPVVMRIQWTPDVASVSVPTSSLYVEEKIEQPIATAVGATSPQQFVPVTKEWGPMRTASAIWRPVTALGARIGFYPIAASPDADTLNVFVVLQKTGGCR